MPVGFRQGWLADARDRTGMAAGRARCAGLPGIRRRTARSKASCLPDANTAAAGSRSDRPRADAPFSREPPALSHRAAVARHRRHRHASRLARARSRPTRLHRRRRRPSRQHRHRTVSRRRIPVLRGNGRAISPCCSMSCAQRRVRRSHRHQPGLRRRLLPRRLHRRGAARRRHRNARRSSALPATRMFSRGPKEFPDLADHLPGLRRDSAVFRELLGADVELLSRPARSRRRCCSRPAVPRGVSARHSLASIATPAQNRRRRRGLPASCRAWLHERSAGRAALEMTGARGRALRLPSRRRPTAGRQANPDCCIDAPGVDRGSVHAHVAALAAGLFQSS